MMKISKAAFIALIAVTVSSILLLGSGIFAISDFYDDCKKLSYVCNVLETKVSRLNTKMSSVQNSISDLEEKLFGSEDAQPALKEDAVRYILREKDGIIAVYDSKGNFLRSINTAVATLPDSDRERLYVGIEVFSDEELEALTADFS